MRQHQVLELDARGIAHASAVLATYLPGLSLGLQPIAPRRLLVPGSTLDALAIEYGEAPLRAILAAAGATSAQAVDDSGAIALLRMRDRPALPARPMPAAVAGVDWHLAAINAPAAWATLGGPGAIAWGGVRVGHIDTGYTRHPAFGFAANGDATNAWLDTAQAQTFFAAHASMDDPGPGAGIDPLAFSMDGHGTRTAATICGFAPNAPGGAYFGIAPKVPLVPVRIANHVWINHAQEEFAQAVDHLIDRAGVAVISLSMGIFLSAIRRRLRRALDKAYERGVIVVCAAGNVVQDVVAPARLNRTLAIGGVTRLDGQLKPWGGSSHGPEIEWSGPAEGIRRAETTPNGQAAYSGGGDGTSYATALTAGAGALWLARHGDAALAAQYPLPWQRVEAFKALARQTVQVPPGWQPGSFGDGVLDVQALLAAPLPPAAATPDASA